MIPASISQAELGLRLRAARSNANLTQEAAAAAIGVSRTTLVAIEKGSRAAKPDELIALATLYDVSVGKMLKQQAIHVDLSAKFRRVEEEGESPEAIECIRLLSKLATGAQELEQATGSVLRIDYPAPIRIAQSGYLQQAEDVAGLFRQRLGIHAGKVGDLFSTLELDMGVRIFARSLPSSISGLYAFDPSVGACILINANHPRRRRLQTLTHECAHFVTDRSEADILDEGASVSLSVEERFARRFGYAFLMPSSVVRSRFDAVIAGSTSFDLRSLVLLAHQFDVTTEAMCRRLEELELLAVGTWETLKDAGYSMRLEREVLGDVEPATRPPLVAPRLAYLAARALNDETLSEGQICEMLAIDRSQLTGVVSAFSGDR